MKASQYLFLIIVEVFGKDQKKKRKIKRGGEITVEETKRYNNIL